MQRGKLPLSPEQYGRFVERLEALLEEFHNKEAAESETPFQPYGFTVLVYPAPEGAEGKESQAGQAGGTTHE